MIKKIAVVLSLLITLPGLACDLCSIYNSVQSRVPLEGSWHIGAAEQITNIGTVRTRGSKVDNTAHQGMTSSITQLLVGYDQTDRLSYQVSVPFISRRFGRVNDEGTRETGTASGIGDLSLIARYAVLNKRTDNGVYILQLLAGIKLPTGDAHRLGEEGDTGHHEEEGESEHEVNEHKESGALIRSASFVNAHGGSHHEEKVTSVVHGHDLALGSGSIDFPIGSTFFIKRNSLFLSGDIQYMMRNKGGFGYRHANDLNWSFGPGYFINASKKTKIAPRVVLSGSYKQNDKNREHENEVGTSLNAVYIGPELLISTGAGLGGELGFDLPVYTENSGTQAVPSSRIRAALNWQY